MSDAHNVMTALIVIMLIWFLLKLFKVFLCRVFALQSHRLSVIVLVLIILRVYVVQASCRSSISL
jgi:predicted ABC-type sugar transport system permease subunit